MINKDDETPEQLEEILELLDTYVNITTQAITAISNWVDGDSSSVTLADHTRKEAASSLIGWFHERIEEG